MYTVRWFDGERWYAEQDTGLSACFFNADYTELAVEWTVDGVTYVHRWERTSITARRTEQQIAQQSK